MQKLPWHYILSFDVKLPSIDKILGGCSKPNYISQKVYMALCLACTCVIVVESDAAKKASLFDSVRRPCEKLFQNMRFLTFTPKMGPGIPNQNNFWSHSILSQSFRYDVKLKLCVPPVWPFLLVLLTTLAKHTCY